MLFLKVPAKEAESTRRQLAENGKLSNEYDIFSEGGFVFIPVLEPYGDFDAVELDALKRPLKHTNLRAVLSGLLTGRELEDLTTSFDIIGDIAIVEIPESLESREEEIGNALLKVHSSLRTVLKKLGAMEGEYRIRKLKRIAGENRTETIYREHGVPMRLDVSKAYFSVRLSTERKRISDLIRPGEKVLVLFAGVGPFALVIAKDHPDAQITAVEINPDAAKYLRENVRRNKACIIVLEGDARDFEYSGFDRVVMPLPHSAEKFLGLAFDAAKTGGSIHFYSIVKNDDPFGNAEKKIPLRNYKISGRRIVRPYSPDMVQVVLDLIKTGQETD
jgi:tRNA (guanine37-N1)-methyltransferase